MSPFKRKLMNVSEDKADKAPAEAGALIEKTEENSAVAPVKVPPEKEAFGFKLGKKVLQMTITATEITRVEPDGDQGLMEAKYKLTWQGITGKGLEKDVTIRFMMDTPEGTEDVLLQQEMMVLIQEAKRKFVS